MALKRKRSTPSLPGGSPLSYTSTSTNASSTIPSMYSQSKPTEALEQKPTWSFPTYESSGDSSSYHLGSRTRKRHRDGRPDENTVYANTLSKLYSAHRQHPQPEPMSFSQPPPPITLQAPAQKSTLHSFWNISSQPPDTLTPMLVDIGPVSISSDLKCDDCDGDLVGGDAMDMDVDLLAQEHECQNCKRRICDRCAVLGNERVCLECGLR